jgi:hypothetical protein
MIGNENIYIYEERKKDKQREKIKHSDCLPCLFVQQIANEFPRKNSTWLLKIEFSK